MIETQCKARNYGRSSKMSSKANSKLREIENKNLLLKEGK